MYNNVIVLTKEDLMGGGKVPDIGDINLEMFGCLKGGFLKPTPVFRANLVIYIDDFGNIKVLKDRSYQLTNLLKSKDYREDYKKEEEIKTSYFVNNQGVKYNYKK
jgi:hypothetical protein